MDGATFQDRLRDASDRLTEADTRAVRAILDDPRQAALLTVSELASRAGVHEATATRLAQKLGYKGYPAMREALQVAYISGADAGQRLARSVARIGQNDILDDLVATEVEALLSLAHHVESRHLDASADLIAGARRVFIFAMGNAAPLADLADRRLRRFGFDTVLLAGDPRTLAERLSLMKHDDCMLAFAFRARPRFVDGVFGAAKSADTRIVLIADLAASAVCPPAFISLAAPRGRSGEEFQTLTVPMAIVNALILTIARRHRERTIGALDAVSELTQRLA
ncbi:MAG: MurR/RpiR family transcriptional regulator [Beijerinckiaceae bacterium]